MHDKTKNKNRTSTGINTGSSILVVEDDPEVMDLYRRLVGGYPNVLYAVSGTEALELIWEADDISLGLIDFNLPGASGLEVIRELKRAFPNAEEVVVTANNDVQAAVESIKAGATRFITKPFNPREIVSLVEQNLERERLRNQVDELRSLLYETELSFMVVGKSKAMRQVMELMESVAGMDVTVLLLGETGTGKDLLARVIHEKSPRAEKPFVITDCAVLTEKLIESDLFGHQKGAFTGAHELRRGKFERADGGTIFLNEIETLPLEAQAKLLRVLEDSEMERVGGSTIIKVNVRVIAACNSDLEAAVDEGLFRRDLFHRLNIVTLYLPPLKERREDIPILANHFLAIYSEKYGKEDCRLDEAVYDILFSYPWPGNIRELENTIERAVITAKNSVITVKNLPPLLLGSKRYSSGREREIVTIAESEDALIREALNKCESNLSRTAELLGIARGTLYSKMKKYRIPPGFTGIDRLP